MTRQYVKRVSREDQKRIPAGQPRMKMTVKGLKPGERGRWADESEFEDFQRAGYTFVQKDGIDVGADGEGNTDLGSIVSLVVDRSSGKRNYLMKISEEWYQENQAIKQQANEEKEKQSLNPGPNQYIPEHADHGIKNEFRK